MSQNTANLENQLTWGRLFATGTVFSREFSCWPLGCPNTHLPLVLATVVLPEAANAQLLPHVHLPGQGRCADVNGVRHISNAIIHRPCFPSRRIIYPSETRRAVLACGMTLVQLIRPAARLTIPKCCPHAA